MDPAEDGAVVVIVNAAVPLLAPAAKPLESVTVQLNNAPAEFRFVQLTELTPVPAVAAVAVTPAGSWSFTVADVPDAVPPLLPRPMVYVNPPLVNTVAAPDLLIVMLEGVLTVVVALPQFVVEPAEDGAVVVIVNAAVPLLAPAAKPLESVTVQLNNAPAEFRFVQLTELTPVPAVAAVAVTPAGSWSFTVADVPDA